MVGVGFLSATSGVSHPGEFTRAIKRPLGAATPSKLRDGMLVPFYSRGNSRAGMTTDPSIHVNPRIKESTSCKTANRYYEEKRREEGGGGLGDGLGTIPKPSSSGDVILGNSQSVIFFLFSFPLFFIC